MPMKTDWITVDEAAERLGLDRSGVFRMAKRGDFGPIQSIGGKQRPAMLLVPAAGVDAIVAQRKAS